MAYYPHLGEEGLGRFTGDNDIIIIIISVLKGPTSLDSKFMNRVGLLDWQFMVEELPLQPGDPGFPQTGDTTNIALYLLPVAGFGALTVVMFIILFRRKKKEEESV